MKIEIWIASHISNDFRLNTIKDAVRSACAQTSPCKLRISFSHNERISKENVLNSITENAIGSEVDILYSDKRLLQFEHLKRLWDTKGNVDFVAFLDDDDFITPDRIASFLECYEENRERKCFVSGSYDCLSGNVLGIGMDESSIIESERCDFAHHIVHISCLDKYFSDFFEKDIKISKGYTDIMFKVFIQGEYGVIKIPGRHYIYRSDISFRIKYPEGRHSLNS